jgi:serine/threonine protein kinase
VTTDIDVNLEPLPGYRLLEHIGSGGFGEVWRAEAPGGLTKAIKFVFGQLHERRASNELRALDRVRGVRHPFLLSLERIETVDGRLVVVTELADGSLKDRFEACRREGLSGVPRDELLGYLRDAADALDFMSEAHALQHLDIKPENLLLLAGHVKVADFGLVKDMRQSEASMVGGMTPLYAAPEVFRGGPSPRSDQYSLAIVYLEMLTGKLPFVAGNAAELTLQHLNDLPDLSALSTADRYAVSRALAKDPKHRYTTCREFVDALVKSTMSNGLAGDLAGSVGQSGASSEQPRNGHLATDLVDDSQVPWNTAPEQMILPMPLTDAKLVDLPPIDIRNHDARPVPAVVIGIGGAAGQVLSQLRRMIDEQSSGSVASGVQFLLLDTDAKSLAEAARRHTPGFTPSETLHLPLRLPQHYRERSQLLLQWLSRRWLYNIPRSLKTEGLRPLGRLALVDHARDVVRAIRQTISQAMDTSRGAIGTDSGENQFRRDAVRVFVVASISGGTGGGMALDVGFAARAVLKQMGLSATELIGVMMHATGRDSRHSELARVNAFAWLTEYEHFQRPENAYVGDSNCGLPSHNEGIPAFDHTYLIHLGESLDAVDFEHAAQGVAEYLRLNTRSPAVAFFGACRQDWQHAQSDNACGYSRNLRSFGVHLRTAAPAEMCDELAAMVSRQVLAAWQPPQVTSEITSPLERFKKQLPDGSDRPVGDGADGLAAAEHSHSVPGAAQLVRRLQIDATGIAANARSMLELQLGGDAATFLAAWAAKQSHTREAGEREQLEAIDRIFSAAAIGDQGGKAFLLGQSVGVIVQPLEEKLRSEIRRWFLGRVDDPRERLPGARGAVCWLNDHFCNTEVDLKKLRQLVLAKLAELRERAAAASQTTPGDSQSTESTPESVLTYFRLRIDQSAIAAAEHIVRIIVSDAKSIADELTALSREIDQMETVMARAATAGKSSDVVQADCGSWIASEYMRRASFEAVLPKLAAEVDARLQAEYIHENGGLVKTIVQGGRPRALLSAKLQELSRRAVHQFLADVNVLEQDGPSAPGQSRDELRSGLAAATSPLLEFGGTRRVLAMLPRDSASATDTAELSQTLGVDVTGVRGADNSLTLCVEAGQLSIQHVALEVVQRRRDRVDFAKRVHCRNDIAWSSLLSGNTTTLAACEGADRRSTADGHKLCKTLVI